jgi:hypothetical protein
LRHVAHRFNSVEARGLNGFEFGKDAALEFDGGVHDGLADLARKRRVGKNVAAGECRGCAACFYERASIHISFQHYMLSGAGKFPAELLQDRAC